MRHDPIVSVIMPCFNQGHFLGEAIESVLQQSYSSVELIVIDDGSADNTPAVARRYAGRVNYVRQENQGLSIARNTGILQSLGEYLAFLDSDDLWKPDKLKKQVELMEADTNIALCHTGFQSIFPNGTISDQVSGRNVSSYYDLLHGNGIGVLTVLLRRGALAASGLFDPLYQSVQDFDMWLKLARRHKFAFIPSSEALYRQHSSSMTSNRVVMYAEVRGILQKHLKISQGRRDYAAAAAATAGIRREDQRFTNSIVSDWLAPHSAKDWRVNWRRFQDGFIAHQSRALHVKWIAWYLLRTYVPRPKFLYS